MSELLTDLLSQKRYPGRFIVIAKDAGAYVALYGVTGRSPSSLARKLVERNGAIYTTGVGDTVQKEGNPELLEYPAFTFFENGLVVANGRQIEKVTELQNRDARQQLSYALSEEAYEPDEYRTPRITGCIVRTNRGMDAALHIARSASDGTDLSSWSVTLEEGSGQFISTYGGGDVKPTPSFAGNPLPVSLEFGSAKKAADALFKAMQPPNGEMDYRVGFVAVYVHEDKAPEIAIVNRIR